MREFINIVMNEAQRGRNSSPAIDTSRFKAEITLLLRKFAAQPFAFRFKRDWVEAATRLLAQRKALEASHRDPDDDDEALPFDGQEYLPQIIDQIWHHGTRLSAVRANIAHEHDKYQQRAAERHGFDDDDMNYIESSNYLSGMSAMEDCAQALQCQSLSDPRCTQVIIQACQRFIADWHRYEFPDDGGEAPILDEDFVNALELMLPLMLMQYS